MKKRTERTRQMMLRLSDREYIQAKKKIRESGMKQQDYLLDSVLGKKIYNLEELRDLILELKRQGVNLNQVAKQMNANQYPGKVKFDQTMEEVRRTWESLRQYLQGQE